MKYYGSHISLEKSYEQTILRAVNLNISAIQIFTGPPSRIQVRVPTKEDSEIFIKIKSEQDIKTFVHMPYILNTGNLDKYDWKSSSFLKYLDVCMELEIDGVVWHTGAAGSISINEGRDAFRKYLELFIAHTRGSKTVLAPENTATLGTQITCKVDDLLDLLEDYPTVKMTFDYAHAYGSGCDLNDHGEQDRISNRLKEKLALVHLNDTPILLGKHVDRHSSVFDPLSQITPDNMERIMTLLKHVPHVLERDKINQDEVELMKRV
jgi:endonuclease IV